MDCRAGESLAGPPRSARVVRRVRRRPRRASSRTRRRRLGGRQRRRSRPRSRWRAAPARGASTSRSTRPLEDGVTVDGDHIVERRRGVTTPLMPLASVRLPGRHLLADVLAAAAVGFVAGVPPAAMQRAVERFRGLEHALERVGEHGGVRFVNDSKATNSSRPAGRSRALTRRRRDHGRPLQGRRLRRSRATSSGVASPRSWRSAKRATGSRPRFGTSCPCITRRRWRRRQPRVSPRRLGRRRPARAGVLELRHVSGLRRSRRAFKAAVTELKKERMAQ